MLSSAVAGNAPDREALQRDVDAVRATGATGRPVPWNAKHRIGSTTKPFVATVVLQLVGEGKVGLDDSVEQWLPGLVAGKGTEITVR